MALFTLPPEAKKVVADVEAFKSDIAAIRQLLERLVEIEEQKLTEAAGASTPVSSA